MVKKWSWKPKRKTSGKMKKSETAKMGTVEMMTRTLIITIRMDMTIKVRIFFAETRKGRNMTFAWLRLWQRTRSREGTMLYFIQTPRLTRQGHGSHGTTKLATSLSQRRVVLCTTFHQRQIAWGRSSYEQC